MAFAEPEPDPDPLDVWAAPVAAGPGPAAVCVGELLEHAVVTAHKATMAAQDAANVEIGFLMFSPSGE